MANFNIRDVTLMVPEAHLTDVLRRQLEQGTYEWGEAKALDAVVRPGDRVLELGSAIGFIACHAKRNLGADHVICVEANPDLIPVLEANLKANGGEQAGVVHGAVVADTHTEEDVTFNLHPAFYSSSLSTRGGQENMRPVTVPALRLGDLLTAFEPDVISMDLEGVEAAITQHVWPGRVRHVVMEIHMKLYGLDVVDQIFAGMARNGFAYQPHGSRGAVVVFQRIGTE